MKIGILLAMLLTGFSTFGGECSIEFRKIEVCADLNWIAGPYLNEKSHFVIRFWNKNDSQLLTNSFDYQIRIYSWMTMDNGHNHGGPRMTATQLNSGEFEVSDARFFMHGMQGFWEVRFDLMKDGQLLETAAERVEF